MPAGTICFRSQNEAFKIEDGILSTVRRGVAGVPVVFKVGAKTGDRFLYPQRSLALKFDAEGREFLDEEDTTVSFWRYRREASPLPHVEIVSMAPGHMSQDVIFRQVACETIPDF